MPQYDSAPPFATGRRTVSTPTPLDSARVATLALLRRYLMALDGADAQAQAELLAKVRAADANLHREELSDMQRPAFRRRVA